MEVEICSAMSLCGQGRVAFKGKCRGVHSTRVIGTIIGGSRSNAIALLRCFQRGDNSLNRALCRPLLAEN